jgi:hypothetical protein
LHKTNKKKIKLRVSLKTIAWGSREQNQAKSLVSGDVGVGGCEVLSVVIERWKNNTKGWTSRAVLLL